MSLPFLLKNEAGLSAFEDLQAVWQCRAEIDRRPKQE
jgi:hypothetical protein